MRTIIVLGFAILAGGQAALACTKPTTPSCLGTTDRFRRDEEQACRALMEAYRTAHTTYDRCLAAEAENARGSDVDRLNAESDANRSRNIASEALSNSMHRLEERARQR